MSKIYAKTSMKRILIALGCSISAWAPCAWAGSAILCAEDFDTEAEGTRLEQMEGWSLETESVEQVPVVLGRSGSHGYGLRFNDRQAQYRRQLPKLPPGTVVDEFRFKLRVMADNDAWTGFRLRLGWENGGFALRFMGGKQNGEEDNYIRVSSGGLDGTNSQWSDLPEAKWRKERWYEVIITDICSGGQGKEATAGTLRVVELNGAERTLVVDEPMGWIGTQDGTTWIDMFVMGTFAVNREVDVDEIELRVRPEK